MSGLLGGDDSLRDTQGSKFASFLTFPLRLLWGFLVFMVQAWSSSREGFSFIRGLPALGVLVATPIALWGINFYGKKISVGPSMGYHSHFTKNGRPEHSKLFSRKLVELQPVEAAHKYRYALDLEASGDVAEASRVMSWLAKGQPNFYLDDSEDDLTTRERNEVQFAKANVWLSQKLLVKQRSEGFDEQRNEQAMEYLSAAIEATPEDMQARLSLAELHFTRAEKLKETNPKGYRENLKSAREALEKVVSQRRLSNIYQVIAMPRLVSVCVELEDEQTARLAYDHATSQIGKLARANPDVFELWLSLVRCSVALKEYDRASDFIREAYRTVKDKEVRQKTVRLASLVFLQQADDFPDLTDESQFRLRLFALCRAIQTNPRDADIYLRLLDYIDVEEGEQHDRWLRNSTDQCPIPSIIHIILGTREIIRGNIVNGQARWDIAQQQFGTTEMVIHRLLSFAVNEDEKYAQDSLITKAIEMFPEQYRLYETRGALARKADNYSQAITDLEVVIKHHPELLTAHEMLADCYEKVGNNEKSDFHRKKIEELLEELEEKEREALQKVLEKI